MAPSNPPAGSSEVAVRLAAETPTAEVVDDVNAASRLLDRDLQYVSTLSGGEHARTSVVSGGDEEYVVRRFPLGDAAVGHETGILPRVQHLEPLVPRLVAADVGSATDGPLIVTSRVPGGHPAPTVSPTALAEQMADMLALIHASDGAGLRRAPASAPSGRGPFAAAARSRFDALTDTDLVLTHYDYWCGNTLWLGDRLTGVVDWSGARQAPRGQDLAWCRLDFVLMGHAAAAEAFLSVYEQHAGGPVRDMVEWDLQAAAQAEDDVEDWAPNYAGIGLEDLTAARLRQRLSDWGATRLTRLTAR